MVTAAVTFHLVHPCRRGPFVGYRQHTAIAEYDDAMSSIAIRNLDPAVKERLRVRAAENGHSMGQVESMISMQSHGRIATLPA
jgi:hypothetical protein